jgi:hypothetical protein
LAAPGKLPDLGNHCFCTESFDVFSQLEDLVLGVGLLSRSKQLAGELATDIRTAGWQSVVDGQGNRSGFTGTDRVLRASLRTSFTDTECSLFFLFGFFGPYSFR